MDVTENTGEIYFASCKHRSRFPEEADVVPACCGAKPRQGGYFCWEKNIKGLQPAQCENCESYKKRVGIPYGTPKENN